MRKPSIVASIIAGGIAVAAAAEGPRIGLVVSAPGYPGSAENAQPTMDDLASAISRGIGWDDGSVRAEYAPSAEEGRARLADEANGLALLPLPFFLQIDAEMRLDPVALVAQSSDGLQVWSLVAGVGLVETPADLSGWTIVSSAGYAPRFVRDVALSSWGGIPDDTSIEFDARLLAKLRSAAKGEKIAVLLDEAQAGALDSLPFAGDLEVLARSNELPEAVVCVVEGRVSRVDAERLAEALVALRDDEGAVDLLDAMRVERFLPLPGDAIEGARRAFGRTSDVGP